MAGHHFAARREPFHSMRQTPRHLVDAPQNRVVHGLLPFEIIRQILENRLRQMRF